MARERKNSKGYVLTPGAVAPFVVDAPFGVLDNSYKANIAKELPESINQIIFLLSSSHWEGTVEEVIREKIGAEYNLVLEVSSDKGDKEVSNINILGNKFECVRYQAEHDMTKVEEIGRYV